MRNATPSVLTAIALWSQLAAVSPAAAVTAASDWQQGYNSRVRIVAATIADGKGGTRLVAGVQLELGPGWKTYWRTPGDSGGMPPEFDWDESRNIAKASVHFPAPHRFADALGTSVGYKDEVLFPIDLEPKDAGKPVELKVGVVFGICKDICIPGDAVLSLIVPSSGADDPAIAATVARFRAAVPRLSDEPAGGASEPVLERFVRTKSASGSPELLALVRFPVGAAETDLFIEADDYSYVPVPVRDGEEGGLARFRVDLTKVDAPAAIAGKTLRVTIVSAGRGVEIRRRPD